MRSLLLLALCAASHAENAFTPPPEETAVSVAPKLTKSAPKLRALERTEPAEAGKAAKPFVYPFVYPFWDKESVTKTTESVKELWSKPQNFCASARITPLCLSATHNSVRAEACAPRLLSPQGTR